MKFDAIVIGAGQAGPPLADRLTSSGMKVALIERDHPGGTCVNNGCIPTKTLVASARVAHVVRRASEFGVPVDGPIRIDMKRVKQRKDEVALASRDGVTRWLETMENLRFIRGHARFESDHRVRVGDETLESERIFINTGARPRVPGFAQAVPAWTNEHMMEVDFVPEHLAIVGGGYIGMEFAQMYRRFGSRVTVIEMGDRILRREDAEVSDAVRRILEREGVSFRVSAECLDLRHKPDGFRIRLSCDDEPKHIEATNVLLAVGRQPNTDDLGLDQTGVRTDSRGFIEVDEELRTSVEGVWAIGEVNGRGAFTHTAYNDHEIVAENLLDGADRRVSDRLPIYGVFIDPPLGRVGMNDHEARASGKTVLKGFRPMSRVGRARERSETAGFMSILVDAESRKFLGATVLGIEGDEAIHGIADLMYAGASVEILRRAVHVHPTVAELLPTLAGSLRPLD